MSQPLNEDLKRLLEDLPPGRLLGPCQPPHPVVWMSDGPVADAAARWKRLYADCARTGLYPLLLEYPDDSFEPVSGEHGATINVVPYFQGEWKDDSWLPFKEWPGLAAPATAVANADVCAGELAAAVVRDGSARCLALVQVARSADLPAAVNWRGMTNHMSAEQLSAVLRSWEDRFGVRVVAFGHGSLYVSVAAPPADIHQANILTAEHYLACPDVFYVDPTMDWSKYPEELMERREWRFWWD